MSSTDDHEWEDDPFHLFLKSIGTFSDVIVEIVGMTRRYLPDLILVLEWDKVRFDLSLERRSSASGFTVGDIIVLTGVDEREALMFAREFSLPLTGVFDITEFEWEDEDELG